jgi:hypothetical protein
MSVSEDDMRRAVDDVLEPAWPSEHRLARRRWRRATVARAVVGTLLLWALASGISLLIGRTLPPTFYAFVGGLAFVGALHEGHDPDHLRRH